MLVGGRKSKKTRTYKKQHTYKKRGGCGMSPLQPANYDGVGTIAAPAGDANFAGRPPFSTTQVGGGISYGYDNGADAGVYGGSYFPISKACMAATDPSRGGNNYMSGGKRRKSMKSKKSKKSKSKKYGGSKRKSRSAKKYRQKGCSKKGGLFILA